MTRPSHTGAVDTIRVLHIDDEREPLRMTKKLLEMADEGLKVESVSSPVEALEMLREGGFDCVVTDFKMSPMDGIEVARSIRESSDIPIILYTGHGSEDVAVKAFAVGIDDYVRKELHPLHFEVLANRVRGVVERRWAEKLYGDILDGSRDGVLLLEGTNFIYANQAMADLLGVSDPRELIGRDSLDWIHKSDRERVKRYSLGRQRGEDMPSVYEYNVETSDGRERVFETSASLINFRGRKGSLEFTRDITERRQIRDELKYSEQRWRSLVELAPDGIVTLDLMGRVTSINAAFTKLTGFNKDEIVGKHFTKVGTITTKDMGRYVKLFASFVRGKALPVIEFDYRRKDGSLGKGESVAQIVELEEGKKEVLAILRDVSDRSRMEEDLRESEERHRSLFDDSPVSLWEEDFSGVKKRLDDLRESGVIDLRTYLEQNPDEVLDIRSHVKITAVNKATLDLYGAKDLEELRRGFASMFTEESHAFFREELVALSEGKTIVEGESTTITLRGDRRHVGLRLVVPPGYEESLEKVILSVVDITEMKQLEEERLGYSRELEMRVEERTRELLDAERMAAAGSVAAMVGHDLRGPLQSIKNAAYLLGKSPGSPEEALRIIEESVDRAAMMLREFRDQTREEPLAVVDVDLGELLGRAVEEAGIPEGVDASVEVDGGVGGASLDVFKIRRVLDNLIGNAVEAMPKGGVLRVRGSRGEGGVVIEVSDTGEGIRDEVMGDLFKPFHTTKPGGLGLGLAYCRRAVEAHGGSITVESGVGAGTTFTVLLPGA